MKPRRSAVLALILVAGVGACDSTKPLRWANRPPVVRSFSVFPETIAPGDSAIVVCEATDPDDDSLSYFWYSDCRLLKKGAGAGGYLFYSSDHRLVVYAGSCVSAPVDTGWVSCEASDRKGGVTSAGVLQVVIKQ